MKKNKKTRNLTLAIFIGLILGIVFGLLMPGRFEWANPAISLVSGLYMNALRMMIYPLVFCPPTLPVAEILPIPLIPTISEQNTNG